MKPDRVTAVSFTVAAATPTTNWTFIEIETADGLHGVGEATLATKEVELEYAAAAMTPRLLALAHAAPDEWQTGRPELPTIADAAVFSAIDQALWDIEGRREGASVAAILAQAGPMRSQISLYANINRRTVDRSPQGFADSALLALGAGYGAIKIAPFDEVKPNLSCSAYVRAIDRGFKRIAAARTAIGSERRLMIDCHWRFSESGARTVIDQAAQLGVYWVECPIPESDDQVTAIARLRAYANTRGVLLAGCEEMTRLEGFAPYLEANAYDVMMPDAKYAGGLSEMMELSKRFAARGTAFSPHNPSGPVCHAASLQVCAAASACDCLEIQFDETSAFVLIQGERVPQASLGTINLSNRPGLGVTLDTNEMKSRAVASWVMR